MNNVFFIHGWSVESTETYRSVHRQLAANGFNLQEIYLGRYVSLEDKVEIADLALAMHRALNEQLGGNWTGPFHFVTHSTGALIVKKWIADNYTGSVEAAKGLKNVVFMAGPQFGSRLAHHGRSMLANAVYAGPTGDKILEALELGSAFIWEINRRWLDPATWKDKGIRPFCLTGDRVDNSVGDWFKAKIFPANYEEGSDMVIRVPAANLNHKRFRLLAQPDTAGRYVSATFEKTGEIKDVPFAALSEYTHGGEKNGIINSISNKTKPGNHLALELLLLCLNVKTDTDYRAVATRLQQETAKTAKVRRNRYAQLDFLFTDSEGFPVNDYVFKLGAIVKGKKVPSDTVVHTHKNTITPSHFTAFICLTELEPQYEYFFELDSDSGSFLFSLKPDPLIAITKPGAITDIIVAEQTTQIEVVLRRDQHANLFVYHKGDDPSLHVKWDRKGSVIKRNIPEK